MMTIGVCDDQVKYIEQIHQEIEKYFTDTCGYRIEIFKDGKAVLKEVEQLDILFLDIEMPGMNGIEIKEMIRGSKCKIVFVSNYEQFMSEAFGANVIGFIKKNEIVKIGKYLDMVRVDAKQDMLLLGNQYVDICQVVYVKSNGAYSSIHMSNGEIIDCSMNLSKIMQQFNADIFFRIHKSYVVNFNFVRNVLANKTILKNNEMLPVSRNKKTEFKESYAKYLRSKYL